MRTPYGDIDDRVRAIAMAMDLTPIIWTGCANSLDIKLGLILIILPL
jgi:hypothetical protein